MAIAFRFPNKKLAHLESLITGIYEGDLQAAEQFAEEIEPWLRDIRKKTEVTIIQDRHVDESDLEDAASKSMSRTLDKVRAGGITKWNEFSRPYEEALKQEFNALIGKGKDKPVHLDSLPSNGESPDKLERLDVEALQGFMKNSLPPKQADTVNQFLRTGSHRSDRVKEEITKERYGEAIKTLRDPHHKARLDEFLHGRDKKTSRNSESQPQKTSEPKIPHAMQDSLTSNIRAMINQKRIIRSYLVDEDGNIDRANIAAMADLRASWIDTITDVRTSFIPRPDPRDGSPAGITERLKAQIGSDDDCKKFQAALEEIYKLDRLERPENYPRRR